MDPKCFWTPLFDQTFFGLFLTQNFGLSIFWTQKVFKPQIFWRQIFGGQIFLADNFLLFFGNLILFSPYFFWTQIFGPKIYLNSFFLIYPQFIRTQSFVPKVCSNLKCRFLGTTTTTSSSTTTYIQQQTQNNWMGFDTIEINLVWAVPAPILTKLWR